jgi:hypothetical protein
LILFFVKRRKKRAEKEEKFRVGKKENKQGKKIYKKGVKKSKKIVDNEKIFVKTLYFFLYIWYNNGKDFPFLQSKKGKALKI